MKKWLKVANVFVVSWIIFVAILLIGLALFDIKLGTKLGEGIFYIKGYYRDTIEIGGKLKNTTVTEQGPGILTVPLAFSCLIALISLFFIKSKKKVDEVK
jgi:hypothetical protein